MKIPNPFKAICMTVAFFICAHLAHAQKTFSGNVSDSTGQPMSGVSVLIKGTKKVTTPMRKAIFLSRQTTVTYLFLAM